MERPTQGSHFEVVVSRLDRWTVSKKLARHLDVAVPRCEMKWRGPMFPARVGGPSCHQHEPHGFRVVVLGGIDKPPLHIRVQGLRWIRMAFQDGHHQGLVADLAGRCDRKLW
jgi:hypothetical protein